MSYMKTEIEENMTVKDLLERYSNLIQTFVDMKLLCAGCPADAFHTLADVAKEYGLDQREFISDLQKAAAAAPPHSNCSEDHV